MGQKLKTKRGASKRFKITASGRIKYKKAGLRHKLLCKSETRKRNLKQHGMIDKSNENQVKQMLAGSL